MPLIRVVRFSATAKNVTWEDTSKKRKLLPNRDCFLEKAKIYVNAKRFVLENAKRFVLALEYLRIQY